MHMDALIFDTHAHYDDEQFDADRDALLSDLPGQGVDAVVNVSASLESLDRTVALTEWYDRVYGAIGIHPDEVDLTEGDIDRMKALCRHEKIVAVGEIGLDYHWDTYPHDVQKKWFAAQLEMARELDMPVIIHSRDAAADTLDMMKSESAGGLGGVLHCFSYSVEMAREYLNMGYYLGIGGVSTFSNAKKLKDVIAYAPIERLVLETDCPYLAPVPYRGKRNRSSYLTYVAEAVAGIKGMTAEEVIVRTNANARRLYRLAGG